MTPVAGRITDAEEDGFVLPLGPAQCLFSPGIPVHRVMRMLQKIGTGLMDEPVYVLMLHVQTFKPYIAIEMPNDKETPGSSMTQKSFGELF